MPDLTIGGGLSLRVRKNTWVQQPSLYQGERMRMEEHNVVSTEWAECRVYECQVYFLDATEETALRGSCPRGFGVGVSGDLPGTPFTGLVDIGASTYQKVTHLGVAALHRVVALHIEEQLP